MNSRIIFYSWQTDSDTRLNRSFIEDCLNRAIKKVNREDLSDLVIDRDTKDVPGMPDIGLTILEKIARSTVVVADLTLINPVGVRRPDETPVSNPNVLFELGYALGKLGPKAMVGVFNTTSGSTEELPFDLRSKRVMTYRLSAGDDKSNIRARLIVDLAAAIRQSLGDTEKERTARHSRIHEVLAQTKFISTEIEEWRGNQNLPKVIQNQLKAIEELPNLMVKSGADEKHQNLAWRLVRDFRHAATLTLNEGNWPRIQQIVSSTELFAGMLLQVLFSGIDKECHGQQINNLARVPSQLDSHLESLQNGQLRMTDLDELSYDLRMAAFLPLIPQHPEFAAGLDRISLDFRQLALRWTKSNPKKEEAIAAIQDIRDRLALLIAKYAHAQPEVQTDSGGT